MVEPRWSKIAGLINTTWWWKTKVVSCLWCKLQRCCFKNLGMEANIWRYLENRQYAHNQQTLGPTNSLGFRVVKMIAAFPQLVYRTFRYKDISLFTIEWAVIFFQFNLSHLLRTPKGSIYPFPQRQTTNTNYRMCGYLLVYLGDLLGFIIWPRFFNCC